MRRKKGKGGNAGKGGWKSKKSVETAERVLLSSRTSSRRERGKKIGDWRPEGTGFLIGAR